MRLAWLETAAGKRGVSPRRSRPCPTTPRSRSEPPTPSNEGEWFWDGGEQFWNGDEDGKPVGGLFNAWIDGTPNDENNDEDCAVLLSATAGWGDRSCSAKYAYLCEEVGD